MMVHVSMPFHGQYLPCGTPPFYLIVWVLLVLFQCFPSQKSKGFFSNCVDARFDIPVSSPWENWEEPLERWKNVGEIAGVMRISQPRKQRLDADIYWWSSAVLLDRNSFFYFSSKETPERIHAFLILHRLKLPTSLAQSEAI